MGALNDSAYVAAKNAWTCYGAFLQEVANDLGWEKAIATQERLGFKFAEGLANSVVASRTGDTVDTGSLAAILNTAVGSLAIDCEHQASDGKVTGIFKQCPIYDGLAASGLDHSMIQMFCAAWGIGERRRWHDILPGIERKGTFRATPGDVCMEEYAVLK